MAIFLSSAAQFRVILHVLADQLSLFLALSGTTQTEYQRAVTQYPSTWCQ